ncbi:MAG TPA: DNA-directed RNA polymerase subunit omega [Thermodesulfobacteriota bacterium]|nr:DNA-directed RNA polymerase subunit omega [Deltaproteobacteria bacterium]HNU71826.1 DNA-directed RNA polymerase subunit omega [Thermodesulfobacteriota bacterium]HOC37878.1 DNA-directed RNA polymerase subunit omega [Thermodesulfobacteriota bacterium]HQO78444.1 DNA-directed RNA polymerase subunit omega [Thermodesulfobacteriota bacterium]
MARVTIEDCLQHVENRFALIHAAIQRATQLKAGRRPLIDDQGEKESVVALREIAAGKFVLTKKMEQRQLPPEEPEQNQ